MITQPLLQKGALLLAIDDTALSVKENLCLYMTKPDVRPEPVLVPSPRDSIAPDNCAAMFYGTVLYDQDRFRMWYHACHWGMNPDWPSSVLLQFAKYNDPMLLGPICYAESDDGIHWVKPPLGQVLFKGTTANNAIDLPYWMTAGVSVILDEGEADPSRRYKMVYQFFPRYSDPPIEGAGNMTTVATAVSPDGLSWTPSGIPYVDHFMEQAAFYKHDGRYVISYQAGDAWGSHFSDGGAPSGRVGLARYSHDFNHWVEGYVESLALQEPRDPALRGTQKMYAQNHIGVAPASFGNVCVGIYGLWHNAPVFHDISCDFGLAVSNDGLSFREPVKGHVFLDHKDSPATPHPEIEFHTNLCQGNGIVYIGDETRIYHSRWRNTGYDFLDHYYGEIALATIPRDRWGALGLFPNTEQGWVWTAPFILGEGTEVTLNCLDAHGLRVELCDLHFNPLAKANAIVAGSRNETDGLDLGIQWSPDAHIPHKNAEVRLKILFNKSSECDPRLFAINLK